MEETFVQEICGLVFCTYLWIWCLPIMTPKLYEGWYLQIVMKQKFVEGFLVNTF